MISRLNSISSDLATAFVGGNQAVKIAALYFACLHAVRENVLEGSEVEQALDSIRTGRYDSNLSERLSEISNSFDEMYFEWIDANGQFPPKANALSNFLRARAASALAFGLDAQQPPVEAMYEAISASSDRDSLIADLLRILTT